MRISSSESRLCSKERKESWTKERQKMKKAARPSIIVSIIVIIIAAIMFSNAIAQRPLRGRGQSDSQLEKPPVPKDENEK